MRHVRGAHAVARFDADQDGRYQYLNPVPSPPQARAPRPRRADLAAPRPRHGPIPAPYNRSRTASAIVSSVAGSSMVAGIA